jgi:hypothetical protein
MIIDVHRPEKTCREVPDSRPHRRQAQMVRMCLGSDLPQGTADHVYLLRNVQGGASAGYQVWDVTDVNLPVLKSSIALRSTHKDWWECNTALPTW